jgi:hypothetical protein
LKHYQLFNWDRLHFRWRRIKERVQFTEGLKRNHLVYMTRDGHAGMSLGQKLIVRESKRPGVFEVMSNLTEAEIVRMALRPFIGETIKYDYTAPAGELKDRETGQIVQLPEYNLAKRQQRESYEPIRWAPLMAGNLKEPEPSISGELKIKFLLGRTIDTCARGPLAHKGVKSFFFIYTAAIAKATVRQMSAGREGTSNIVRASRRGARASNFVTEPPGTSSAKRGRQLLRGEPTRSRSPTQPRGVQKRRAESSGEPQPGSSTAKRRHYSSSPPRMALRDKLAVVLKPRKGIHPQAKRHLGSRKTQAEKDDFLTCKSPQEMNQPCLRCGEIGHFRKRCGVIIRNCSYCLEYQSYFVGFAQDKTTGRLKEHAIEACVRLPYGCDWCKTRGHFDRFVLG